MNRQRKRRQKGFTIVELLVVLVILGILASLVVPRLVAQTRGAETAEGTNMLGAIRRTVSAQVDSGSAVNAYSQPPANAAGGTQWTALGLGPLPATARFIYTGDGANVTATNKVTAANTIVMDITTGAITCNGAYTAILDTAGNTVGCR